MKLRIVFMSVLAVFILAVLTPGVQAQTKYPRPETYIPTFAEFEKHKRLYDDPRPVLKDWPLKSILPKDFYAKITFDQEKMKALWAELVGFKAPDVVGKVHPEIKPGKYTYKDVQNNPAFKQLLPPILYERMTPAGGNFAGNITEFEIIPTRQYYHSLPVAELTKKNAGKCKLDAKGYMIYKTWEGGYAFPKPAGQFKAQQVMYNVERQYINYHWNSFFTSRLVGYNSARKVDFEGRLWVRHMGLAGRVEEPLGWYDDRARQLGETDLSLMGWDSPRDQAGMNILQTRYLDAEKPDSNLVYIPAFRRVRKMSGTDTQDAIGGQDLIYDDNGGWAQKLTPNRYPYKFDVEEKELLMLAPSVDGAEYVDSKTLELKNVRLERRPIYVVKLTQLDKNYVYGSRTLYVDKEVFFNHYIENFDQRGRRYRSFNQGAAWVPDMGQLVWYITPQLAKDHVDLHSNFSIGYQLPVQWNRDDVRLSGSLSTK